MNKMSAKELNSLLKRDFKIKITLLDKTFNENGDKIYKVNKEFWIADKRKDFVNAYEEDLNNGIYHKIEVVDAAPTKFRINTIYILANGERVWIFAENIIK